MNMGAETFICFEYGNTAKEAFNTAKREYYCPGGYSGTIAEKTSFIMIDLDDEVNRLLKEIEADDSLKYSDRKQFKNNLKSNKIIYRVRAVVDLMLDGDPRVDDKWGPAGCIKVSKDRYCFFGWASS